MPSTDPQWLIIIDYVQHNTFEDGPYVKKNPTTPIGFYSIISFNTHDMYHHMKAIKQNTYMIT